MVPFALAWCLRRLAELGYSTEALQEHGRPLMSDNGNILAMCSIGPLPDPARTNAEIRSVPGVVETGLFVGMADVALIQDGEHLEIREKAPAPGNPVRKSNSRAMCRGRLLNSLLCSWRIVVFWPIIVGF